MAHRNRCFTELNNGDFPIFSMVMLNNQRVLLVPLGTLALEPPGDGAKNGLQNHLCDEKWLEKCPCSI
jgi:hypothetical protein